MDFLQQAASAATKLAAEQKPAAEAPAAAAPAAAAPAAAAPAAAAPAAAAPAAAAPSAAAPVDVKATLMHAADEFKSGDYMGAVQDVMKTGLVQKLAASQAGKQGADGAAPAGGDLMGQLGGLVSGFTKK